MMKELGQIAGLMKQLPKIKDEMERLHERVSEIQAEGDAGGAMVKIRVSGKMEILSCRISDDAMRLNDREMLEDLVRAATNQALERARQQVAEETGKMASSFGLPSALGLTGMPFPGT